MGKQTSIASSYMVMSIIGGAIFPVIMGKVSDLSNIQTAYLVPACCFFVVLLFAIRSPKFQAANFETNKNLTV